MWRTAQSPRKGMEPWATRPFVSISAHQTPRWPMQTRSTLSGSGMMTWSTRGREKKPFSARYATPAKPPDSSSTVPETSIAPGKSMPASRIASSAITEAAMPPFMSQAPRPYTLPSRTSPAKGSTDQPRPGATTSIWPLKWTQGPGPRPSKRATTLVLG